MRKTILLTSAFILVLGTSGVSHSKVFFEFNGENGYQYMGATNAHPGGGYFFHMGGTVSGSEGTGCSDPRNYHNTILSNDAAAQGAIEGSKYALKTPYSGNCPDESFARDTTIIRLAEDVNEYYIRWYQKWTGDWNSADVQHKFAKFTKIGESDSYSAGYFTFGGREYWRCFIPNIDGKFDKGGITRYDGRIWVYAVEQNTPYSGVNRSYDDINNKVGESGTDDHFVFEKDRWYCIEIHVKMNSDADTADAVIEAWVDGKQVFGAYDFKYYDSGEGYGIGNFELQHIYYNRSHIDQPTYMDNIIISDSYNGRIVDNSTPLQPPSTITVEQR